MGKVDIYNLGNGVTGFGEGIKVPKNGVLKDFPEELVDEGARRLTKGEKPFLAIVKAGAQPPKAFRAAKSSTPKQDVKSVKPKPIPEAEEKQPDWESPHRQSEAPESVPEVVAPSVYDTKKPEEAEVVDEAPQPDQETESESADAEPEATDAETEDNSEASPEPEIGDSEPMMGEDDLSDSAPKVAEEEGPQGQEEGDGGEAHTDSLPDPFPDDTWKSLPLVEFVQKNKITVQGSRTKPNMLASIRKHYGVED